jgi:hypothetical protein
MWLLFGTLHSNPIALVGLFSLLGDCGPVSFHLDLIVCSSHMVAPSNKPLILAISFTNITMPKLLFEVRELSIVHNALPMEPNLVQSIYPVLWKKA